MKRKNNNSRRPRQRPNNRRRRFLIIEPEVKHHDLAVGENIVSAGAIKAIPVNAMLEGLGSEQRVGSKVHCNKISFKAVLKPTATTDDGDTVRIMCVQDKQASGNTPTVANVLQSASVHSFRNRETTKRFVILFDKRFTWDSRTLDVAGTAFAERHVLVEFFKEVNFETQYLVSAATFGGISTNSVFLLTISEEADASTLTGIFRTSYTDV